jgi:LmbE family N-acetylglucosaminyl deacetylase
MKLNRSTRIALPLLLLLSAAALAQQITTPDPRYKADILLVVAHPDDDSLVTSYLARAVFDEHKRVAVVFCTNGDSGWNSEGREHARALGLEREIEARTALGRLGITNIWFLNGRDTASQDVLISLASWPSASVLEQMVRLVRFTRPEVVLTWLPSSVAGENHGDHQAAGVIATEAFDMAGDPAVFPSQVAVPIRQFENALEGLTPWQAQKLYYFSDAFDTTFLRGHGPEYDGNQMSPSKHESYLQLAAMSAAAYYTQMPDPRVGKQIESSGATPALVVKLQEGGFVPEPVRLWLGKSHVQASATGDVFDGISSTPIPFAPPKAQEQPAAPLQVEFGGPFGFYRKFWRAHDLESLETLRPEIALQPHDTLTIPLRIQNSSAESAQVSVSADVPANWKLVATIPTQSVPSYGESRILIQVTAPGELNNHFAEIRIRAASGNKVLFENSVFVQTSGFVAGQVK